MNYPYRSARSSIITIFVWVVVIIILALVSPALSEVTTNEQEEFLPVGVESVRALEILREKYPTNDGMPAIAVFHSNNGFDGRQLSAIQDVMEFLKSADVPGIIFEPNPTPGNRNSIESFKSPDGTTFAIPFKVAGSPADATFSDSVDAAVAKAHLILSLIHI